MIRYSVDNRRRVSIALYDGEGLLVRELLRGKWTEPGSYSIEWDGCDGNARAVQPGEYEWRMLQSEGFTAGYLTTLGVNPSFGVQDHWVANWVGDHMGAGTVAVCEGSLYVAAVLTEALHQTLKQSLDGTKKYWSQPQCYDGGKATRIAANRKRVYLLQPSGKIRVLDSTDGRLLATWDANHDGSVPSDIDSHDNMLALSYPDANLVRILDPSTGSKKAQVSVERPANISLGQCGNPACLIIEGQGQLYSYCLIEKKLRKNRKLAEAVVALDIDHSRGEVFIAAGQNAEKVLWYNRDFSLLRKYGGRTRPMGRYNSALFRGINDIAADGQNGFYIAEPHTPPRRVAHIDSNSGKVIREWYGGQSFYVACSTDPRYPSSIWGCSQEGFIHQYRLDYDTGKWVILACYRSSEFGDGLYPFHFGQWRPV